MKTIFPFHFSSNSLKTAKQCELKFFRSYCQKLNSTGKNVNLQAGGYFAKACEMARVAYYTQGVPAKEAIDLGFYYILEEETIYDDTKTNDNVALCFKKYFQKFPMDDSWQPFILPDGTHTIEFEAEFDLGIPHPDYPERNITMLVKLDLLGHKYLPGGELIAAVKDEKTCKSVKKDKFGEVDLAAEEDMYLVDGQMIAYCWAGRQLGLEVKRAYVSRVPICKSFQESFELEIEVTEFMVDQWYKSTVFFIRALVEKYKLYKEHGEHYFFTPSLTEACNAFWESCGYKLGCARRDGEEVLEHKYGQNVRDHKTGLIIPIEEYIKQIETKEK
jgi:hypothetical protein